MFTVDKLIFFQRTYTL